eukprot:COSAG06_NODE_12407_length_1385_cov_18.460243_1_plen_343_part_01
MSESEYAPLAADDDEQRAGLPLEQMDEDERSAAVALVAQKNQEFEQINETMQKMQQQIEAMVTPRPGVDVAGVHRGSVADGEEFVSKREHEVALKENAKLRQLMSSARAVADDEQNLLRVLSSAEESLFALDDEEAQALSSGPPRVPADRTLRQTAPTKGLRGGLYFTRDAQTLVHGGQNDTKLSMWDLQSGTCTVAVERSGGIHCSEISPDSTLLCIAAGDGLAMFRFYPGSPPSCEQLWDIASGTSFCDATFSRDGTIVASARSETGVVEIRDAQSNSTLKTMDGFPACNLKSGERPHGLSFSCDLLAVGGRAGKHNGKQVRLYSIESDFKELTTFELPGE